MSMSAPFLPEQPGDPGDTGTVPAADPAFGGEEPDAIPEPTTESGGDLDELMPEDTPFRTPDPAETRRPTA